MKQFQSHGTGEIDRSKFAAIGANVIFEPGVLVFHPENILIGSNVYVGHYAILKGYYQNRMLIGNDVWIGQQCFFHSAGGIMIGDRVGIGPGVRILTSSHREEGRAKSILESGYEFAPVVIKDDADLGVGTIVLPGVTIGAGVQTGAGSVVSRDIPDYAVAAGVPARVFRIRSERNP